MPNDYEEPVLSRISLLVISQNTNPFTEVKTSLHGSNASVKDELEVLEASSSVPLPVILDKKNSAENGNSAPDSSKPRTGNTLQ